MEIARHQVTEWLNHPVTVKMLEVIKDHRTAYTNGLLEIVGNRKSLTDEDIQTIQKFKGQIETFNEMLNIKTYLIEAIEDEVSSSGTESPNQSE